MKGNKGRRSEIFRRSTKHANPPGTPSWVLESGLGTLARDLRVIPPREVEMHVYRQLY